MFRQHLSEKSGCYEIWLNKSKSFLQCTHWIPVLTKCIWLALKKSVAVFAQHSKNEWFIEKAPIDVADVVSTLADSAAGRWWQVQFPYGVAVDKDDNIYVSDFANQKIKKITQE
jgi:hypothetical protein